jgi:hypothetical protein
VCELREADGDVVGRGVHFSLTLEPISIMDA